MPNNDREVFQYLQADQETLIEIDLLTFAIFAHERQQWCELFEKQTGKPPSQPEIDNWISQITGWRFDQMRQEAIRFFDIAARRYLEDEIETEKQDVLNSTIIREVRAAGGFWRQLFFALLAAILAPLAIGAIVACALLYDRIMPAITDISSHINAPPSSTGGPSKTDKNQNRPP